MNKEKLILYFVKYPEPGKVKTRLAKAIGDQKASQIYKELAETNLQILRDFVSGNSTDIWPTFDPADKEGAMRSWLGDFDHFEPQAEGDLGQRLSNSFEKAFQAGFNQVVAIGSDTLGLHAGVINQAFSNLETTDAVLGPAFDGGYYLIGLSRYNAKVFFEIPWSTDRVFSQTVQAIGDQGLNYQQIEMLNDLDEISDLEKSQYNGLLQK